MRLFTACILCAAVGCSAEQPNSIASETRQVVRDGLVEIGATVTSDGASTTYLSLRNTHVELRELSLNIDGDRTTRKDLADFVAVGEATASHLLDAGEYEQFKVWFQEALASKGQATKRAAYKDFKVTLSRQNLLLLFSRIQP